MIKYEYEHPNHGWVGVNAECDARNFRLLMNWWVRTEGNIEDRAEDIFNIVKVRDEPFEILSSPHFGLSLDTEHLVVVDALDLETGSTREIDIMDTIPYDLNLVQTCPSSDPIGMKMPLRAGTDDLWFLPVPEEVFGKKGVYVRLKMPNRD